MQTMSTKQRMISILAWWLVIFVWYVGWQELSISRGTVVWLQTRPIDPNDFFRGDYVTLSYDISRACDVPPTDTWEEDELGQKIKMEQYPIEKDLTGWEKMMWGKLVYVPLTSSGDVMVASWCSDTKPSQGIYLKGLRQTWGSTLYGIEKYFVQQDSGKELEKAVGTMKVQVSIGRGGKARIVDYKLE